jgi:2-keto-4-pentenoate hydratase/2-oxohepta-3-ene-1,7-dioic acid hydratase in catechol pathway
MRDDRAKGKVATETTEDMKRWLRFTDGSQVGFGTLDANGERIDVYAGAMFGECKATGAVLSRADVELLIPVDPSKFIGLWNNFSALADKLGQTRPERPLYFVKTPNSYLAPGRDIVAPPHYTGRVFYEGELGLVIGKRCHDVDEAGGLEAIFGYTCVNDVTAFDLIGEDASFPQWARAKSCDTFGPFGPVVAEGLDWSTLHVRTLVNGRERQNYPASDMILTPAQIVSHLSREMTLEPGDVIACGTSLGALPMKPGTLVEVAIEPIGTLTNRYSSIKEGQ